MENSLSLNKLKIGEYGSIKKVHASDKVKRRLLDLGIIPSTKIKVLYESPFHDPRAYSIRGAVIALRSEDAELIEVYRTEESLWD